MKYHVLRHLRVDTIRPPPVMEEHSYLEFIEKKLKKKKTARGNKTAMPPEQHKIEEGKNIL